MPEGIAAAVAYLASDDAGMVNCAILAVDTGWTAWQAFRDRSMPRVASFAME